ncbi:ribonuclease III [Hyphomonas jannaschiana]|uniref:Ribonuclease 3 n=1 Tax=Hyphomonas jannaschiana VP2 TaxID=1280952 RepID=A0A059FBP9_9PROT|nr:ribonuclease III [Hyphomonas jannaschiana]KCZ87991.1 ribonuclease III [Hyphomonas jannaschiana VP2]
MKPARPKRTRLRGKGKASAPVLSDDRLKAAQDAIGYKFKDTKLLVRALTHPSAVGGGDAVRDSNQRLEFLGDRVLNLVIAERLMERRKMESEGELAPRLNRLVKKGACADAVRHLELQEFILLSDGEEAAGGRKRESTLGDACEAIIGAIFKDGGLSPARKFIEKAWAPQFASTPAETKDPKTLLQEWAQGQGLPLPDYDVLSRSGPDHEPIYEIEAKVDGRGSAVATGPSKREAERSAAALLLQSLAG